MRVPYTTYRRINEDPLKFLQGGVSKGHGMAGNIFGDDGVGEILQRGTMAFLVEMYEDSPNHLLRFEEPAGLKETSAPSDGSRSIFPVERERVPFHFRRLTKKRDFPDEKDMLFQKKSGKKRRNPNKDLRKSDDQKFNDTRAADRDYSLIFSRSPGDKKLQVIVELLTQKERE